MRLAKTDPTVEISTSSGALRVTIHPARSWLVVLLELGVLVGIVAVTYRGWATTPWMFRGAFIFALVAGVTGVVFQFSGTETIEFDSNKIRLGNEIHGWERKREYRNEDCRELEWMEGSEDMSLRLQFKNGWRTITFGEGLSEGQALQILTELQKALPKVAQLLCSYPDGKKHFLTMGLS